MLASLSNQALITSPHEIAVENETNKFKADSLLHAWSPFFNNLGQEKFKVENFECANGAFQIELAISTLMSMELDN